MPTSLILERGEQVQRECVSLFKIKYEEIAEPKFEPRTSGRRTSAVKVSCPLSKFWRIGQGDWCTGQGDWCTGEV